MESCKECNEEYDPSDRSELDPKLCKHCLKEQDFKKLTCKMCNHKGFFKSCGYDHMKRYQCPKCLAQFIPLKVRWFGKYQGYPAWVSWKDWQERKFA